MSLVPAVVLRVDRGGSWIGVAMHACAACRGALDPSVRGGIVSLRFLRRTA